MLQNTVEQFIMSFVAQLIFCTWLDASQMTLIPIVVVLFVVGRFLFWIGYLIPMYNRTYRALGIPPTWMPTGGMLIFSIYNLLITTFVYA